MNKIKYSELIKTFQFMACDEIEFLNPNGSTNDTINEADIMALEVTFQSHNGYGEVALPSKLEMIIEDLKGCRSAWIFEEDGSLKSDVLLVDILDVLQALKDYEIFATDEQIKNL